MSLESSKVKFMESSTLHELERKVNELLQDEPRWELSAPRAVNGKFVAAMKLDIWSDDDD